MRRINKQKKLAGMIVLFLMLSRLMVYAAGGLAVVETYTGESEAVVYLKGIKGDISNISVQAGTSVCDSVTQSRLSESSQPVKTLIMLDNSLSIPKQDREDIAKAIRNMIADRMNSEQMAIAVFGEGMTYLSEYTMDDAQLLRAVEEITYEKSHTYFTDVLYDVLTGEYIQKREDVFFRMIVFSDGMDNKSIGYTKEELFDLLKEYPVPIYTIGVQTSKKNNNKQLKNMLAVSRMTGAQGFVLNNTENILDINEAVHEDQSIVRLAVMPQQELMDGSRKTLKITLGSGESISTEIVMPQQAKIADRPSPDKGLAENDGVREDISKEDSSGNIKLWMALVPVCLLIIGIAAVAIMIIIKHRKQEAGPADTYGQISQPYRDSAENYLDTEVIRASEENSDDSTVGLWDSGAMHSYQIILTDIHTPSRFFQAPLRNSVVIGRKQGACSVVIDYDMSVSGRHCEIKVHDGGFYISDLQSSNGTYVNNLRILSETELTNGSIIKMGKLELRFEVR